MKKVVFADLGKNRSYKEIWNLQEELLQENVKAKSEIQSKKYEIENTQHSTPNIQHPTFNTQHSELNTQHSTLNIQHSTFNTQHSTFNTQHSTLPNKPINHLLFVEHTPVYTLGKSGDINHVLISEQDRELKGIEFFKINRGGDITFHGPGQLVGYPIFDLEQFKTDLGWYLRSLEEVIILTLSEYGLKGERSAGETGVWLNPDVKGEERKICAMGIRCSRWITMHGFAFNINTDLSYFNHIIPCGIENKQVTSLQKELGYKVPVEEVKEKMKRNFERVFGVEIVEEGIKSIGQ